MPLIHLLIDYTPKMWARTNKLSLKKKHYIEENKQIMKHTLPFPHFGQGIGFHVLQGDLKIDYVSEDVPGLLIATFQDKQVFYQVNFTSRLYFGF